MCDFPLCTYPAGHDGYCIHHSKHFGVKEVKVKKGIAKMSAKRIRVHAAYIKMVADMMKVSDRCELRSPVCTGKAQGLDHVQKRSEKNLFKK
jgi:hypothetical protein